MSRLMRSFLCVAVTTLLVAGVAARQSSRDNTTSSTATGTSAIAGTVVTDDAGSRPIRRVTLTLTLASTTMSTQRVTVTDDAGRFAFTQLPAGNYSALRATKTGYVPLAYGENRTGGIGTPISLAEGQRLTIALKMLRGAVITGVLFDQGNGPAIQTSVQATLIRVVNGQRTSATSIGLNSTTTDDRGVYRIFGLPPGDYLVSATPRLIASGEVRPVTQAEIEWAQQQLQPQGRLTSGPAGAAPGAVSAAPRPAQAVAYTQVFYPGTTDAAGARIVKVAAGEERSGVDFAIQMVPTAKIEGTIVDQNGQAPQNAQVTLVGKVDSAVSSDPLFLIETTLMSRPTVVDGKFSALGVRPGQYTVTARAAPRQAGAAPAAGPVGRGGPAPAMTLWAMTDITVDGNDQSGINLRLTPGMTMSGRVAFDGATLQPPADLSRVTVRLTSAPSASGVTVAINVPTATVSADGAFTLEGVTPGRYLLSAIAPAATPVPGTAWTLRSATVGDVNAADLPFEVKPNQDVPDVAITFTDRTAEISGRLLDPSGQPTPQFSIIVFPTDRSLWFQRSRRVRPPVRTSTDGTFRFPNLLAGEYFLAALSDFEPNDVGNPVFLEQVAAAAMKITVAEGDKKVQDLRVAGGGQ